MPLSATANLRRGLLSVYPLGYDPDAIAYFANSPAITDKQNISDFFAGLKAAGLWNNIWFAMLLPGQNAGTGTAVYTAGGAGGTNALIVNGATWGSNGIDFIRASSQSINTNFAPDGVNLTLGVVGKTTNTTDSQYFFAQDDAGDRRAGIYIGPGEGFNGYVFSPGFNQRTHAELDTDFHFHQLSSSQADGLNYRLDATNSTAAAGDITGAAIDLTAATRSDGALFLDGTIAFLFASEDRYAADAVRTLYKATIGQGLSLP